MSDIGIFLKDSGFDLKLSDYDLELDKTLETCVTISLFTDKRIKDDQLSYGLDSKRGWWGDMFSEIDNDEIGSRLWLLERSKRSLETLRLGEDYCKEALQWLIDDGIASKVEAVATFQGELTEGRWEIEISITKPTGRESKFRLMWDEQKLLRG